MDCCSQGSRQMITYESQVTLQYQMASTRLTTIQYGWSGACCSKVCSSGSSSWWQPSLQEEFMDFCMSPLPPKSWPSQRWISIGMQSAKLNRLEIGYRYSTLAKLAKAILVVPHGNVDTERLFSYIGLNKTKHRNRLGISTLNSLLTVQFILKNSMNLNRTLNY